MLDKRPFGNASPMVSPLTFGAWSIGGLTEMDGNQIGCSSANAADSLHGIRSSSSSRTPGGD
jgi:hypothetical protein